MLELGLCCAGVHRTEQDSMKRKASSVGLQVQIMAGRWGLQAWLQMAVYIVLLLLQPTYDRLTFEGTAPQLIAPMWPLPHCVCVSVYKLERSLCTLDKLVGMPGILSQCGALSGPI